jgi:hypothetical protein
MAKCKNCGYVFHPIKQYKNEEYCCKCRKYHKNCEICGKEIFVQGRTCSKKCAYELRKKSWKQTCGAEHNFCKNSSSRKQWEEKLLKEEGIINVWQREDVKEKSKQTCLKNHNVENISKSEKAKKQKVKTCLKNYGVISGFCLTEKINETMLRKYGKLRITNGKKISEIRNSKEFRKKMEDLGLWIPLMYLSEYEIYAYNVWSITKEHIKLYGEHMKIKLKENKFIFEFKNKNTIDHKFSISEGFKNKVSPEIIGSIVNLEILTASKNSSKCRKCSISLNKLLNDYQNFINENKIDKNDKIRS